MPDKTHQDQQQDIEHNKTHKKSRSEQSQSPIKVKILIPVLSFLYIYKRCFT